MRIRKENTMKTRSQVIYKLMWEKLKSETVVMAFLIAAILYSLISSLLINYDCAALAPWFSKIGKSFDEVIRNTCYGVIAGISFYLVNDFYKNIYTKVDVYNAMFNKLYITLFNATSMVQAISGDQYEKTMGREQMFKCIMGYLCDDKDDFHQIGSLVKNRNISVEHFIELADKWEDANGMRKGFLDVYGNMLTRDEQYSLSRYDYDQKTDLLRTIDNSVRDSDQQKTEILDRDIASIVNMIVGYKLCLTDLANKYNSYAYSMARQKRRSI